MTSRKGGRIPPDGRRPQPAGVGKDAKRHDLERPATPGLHDSDLQQGDVSAMEEGQRIAPIREQPPAATSRRPRTAAPGIQRGGTQSDVPDPLDFLGERLAGTLSVDGLGEPRRAADIHSFLPIVKRIATAPGASGVISQAYLTMLSNASKRPLLYETPLIDMQDADDRLEALLGD